MNQKRKRVFIHYGIQGALVVRLLAQWGLFVVATCAVSAGLQYLLDPLQPAAERMAQLRVSVGAFILVSLCLLPVFLRDAVRFSHRFVGPIMRLQAHLRQVQRVEDFAPIALRERDFWHDVAADYNAMADRLRQSSSAAGGASSAPSLAGAVSDGRDA